MMLVQFVAISVEMGCLLEPLAELVVEAFEEEAEEGHQKHCNYDKNSHGCAQVHWTIYYYIMIDHHLKMIKTTTTQLN